LQVPHIRTTFKALRTKDNDQDFLGITK